MTILCYDGKHMVSDLQVTNTDTGETFLSNGKIHVADNVSWYIGDKEIVVYGYSGTNYLSELFEKIMKDGLGPEDELSEFHHTDEDSFLSTICVTKYKETLRCDLTITDNKVELSVLPGGTYAFTPLAIGVLTETAMSKMRYEDYTAEEACDYVINKSVYCGMGKQIVNVEELLKNK